MPRPRKCRRIRGNPSQELFKPNSIMGRNLEIIQLNDDEFEAVRLRDLEEMDQNTSAEMMGISQPTFHRLLISARKKIADAIINKKALKIGKE